MNLHTGVLGATRQSWFAASPRELLKHVMAENPQANKEELEKLFSDRIRAQTKVDYLAPVIEYFFSNHYRYLTEKPKLLSDDTTRVAELKSKIADRIEEQAQFLLLDMVLANGKQLRECTGKECGELGLKMGAWLTMISENVKADQKVGDVLTEKQVRLFYGK